MKSEQYGTAAKTMNPKKIKVMHIIKTLGLGGAETNLCNLVQATDLERFEVHVAYSFGGEIESRFQDGGIKLFKYADAMHKVKSPASLAIIWRLVRYILKNDIQIVHTHNFTGHVWGTLAASLTGRKVVEHVHDFRYMERGEFLRRQGVSNQYRFTRYLKDLSHAVIVLTKQNRDFILENRFHAPAKIKEIKNGIPIYSNGASRVYDRAAIRERLDIPEGSLVVLTPARMSAEKNLDLFFRIAPKIAERVPNILFLISGNGPLLESSLERCKEMRLEKNLRFIGFYQNVDELLAVSDLFLLPSFLELHSISVLEAMSMKVPVLISEDVGCHNEFIASWENGVLLDPFSEEEWVEAILRLAADRDLRLEIGRRGYETCVEQFNIKKISKEIEEVYAELVYS